MSSIPANLQLFIKYIKLVSFSRHKINSELIFKDQPWKVARFSISQFYFDKHFTMFCVLLAQRWFILEWQESSVRKKKMQSNSLVLRIAQSHWLYLWVSQFCLCSLVPMGISRNVFAVSHLPAPCEYIYQENWVCGTGIMGLRDVATALRWDIYRLCLSFIHLFQRKKSKLPPLLDQQA